MDWLEIAPIWVIGLVIFVALIVAEQLGYAGRHFRVRVAAAEASDAGIGYILSGALALLGLLIAFTFGAASDRFDTRRHLVVDEANSIVTTYRRVQALDDTPRAALSQLMVQYAHARREWFQAGEDKARLARSEAEADDLQARIWTVMLADVRADPTATINPSLFQTTNETFDLAESERAALEARLPVSVLRVVLLYALIAAAIMGYSMTKGTRQQVVSAALYIALSLAICLILDLDRPRSGTVQVSMAPMDRAIAAVEGSEAAKAGAPAAKPPS